MVHQPRYLLLDEPSGFQDEIHTQRLLEALADTASHGACIVVCSHDPRLTSAKSVFHQIRRLDQDGLNPNVGGIGVEADMGTPAP
jgi:ABC-type lipoprotein export system ATPase subunit